MNPCKSATALSLSRLLLAQLCLFLLLPVTRAQTVSQPAATDKEPAQARAIPSTSRTDSTASDDEVVSLSPFEVVADTNGYYSANTMSGTRFNTKLDDLASSITVVTKGQMEDFGMLDINDIFLYVAGTEGTGTYTDYTLDRNGSIADNVQLNPTQANRVRGIAPANVSLGNIETMGRVPVDPIGVESVEISRGANANVFGLGNPSGTVNMVPVSANLTRNKVATELRSDSYGGWRTSLDVNQVLLKGKLAVRGSAVFQHDAFERKPSGVDTERYNGMIKYQPFKFTTITGSLNYYHAYGNRPNSLPPRDNISYWIASGRPYWDASTSTVYRADGTRVGQYTATTYNGPDYFISSYLGNNHAQLFIDQSGIVMWMAPQATTSSTTPTTSLTSSHLLQATAAAGSVFSGTAPRPFAQYMFSTTPTISDRNIYDYTSINLAAPNSFWDRTLTSTVQLDQLFLNTSRQTLAAQFTFMREDSDRWTRNLIGISNDNGQSGQLTIDVNKVLPDGTPNPFYLRPYISVDKPRIQQNPAKWDTSRAQVAYRLDLSREENALKWLGWFQLTGYAEYKYRVNRQYSWREAMASGGASWIPAGTYTGFQSSPSGTPSNLALTSNLYRFYVGDAVGDNVDYAPGDIKLGTYPFSWSTRSGSSSGYSYVTHTDNIELKKVGADKTGGATYNTKTVIRTKGGVFQSHLFEDRLITTLGVRQDDVYTKFGNPGTPTNRILNADGETFDYSVVDGWQPNYNSNGGRTTNVQFVVRPFFGTSFAKRIGNGSGGGFFADLIGNLSVNYNRSNSFLPTNPAQDLYRNVLPNTTGEDKSWGLGLNLFDGKLVLRATHFDNIQKNSQTTDINTLAGRVLRIDFPLIGAGSPTGSVNLYNNAQRWVLNDHPTWSQSQIDAEVQSLTGFSAADADYYINAASVMPIGATSDLRSHGTEIEINANPSRHWTITGSVTDTQAVNSNISKALVDWIDERMPIWTTVKDPSITDAAAAAEGNPNKLWWLHHYTNASVANGQPPGPATYTATGQSPQQNYQAFVGAPLGIIRAQEGKSNPQVRRYTFRMSTAYQLAGLSDNQWLKRMTVGGAVRWEDKGAIGYYGVQSLPDIITDLDPNRPIYDGAHTYVDMFVSYKTKLWGDKIGATFKLNVRNLGQTSHLQPVGAFPDGTIHTYRIVDPQQFFLTASFDM